MYKMIPILLVKKHENTPTHPHISNTLYFISMYKKGSKAKLRETLIFTIHHG